MNRTLSRVDISSSIEDLLNQVIMTYSLGRVISYKFFDLGYEDLNIKLITNKGAYVIKVFSKFRHTRSIKDYIKGLIEFRKAGILTPRLKEHKEGYLLKVPGKNKESYLCVMEYFPGKSLKELGVTEKDLFSIAKIVGKINRLHFTVISDYDSWGVTNVVHEYSKNNKFLAPEDLTTI